MSEEEKDVVLVINATRTNPKKFAELYVKELASYYDGKYLQYPGADGIRTREGKKAVNELYQFLQNQKTLPILSVSLGMSKTTLDHVKDQNKTEKTSQRRKKGSSFSDRIDRYGIACIASESTMYGESQGIRIVLNLLVNDGLRSRVHRKNILNTKYRVMGVANGGHKKYEYMSVMDYAGEYEEE